MSTYDKIFDILLMLRDTREHFQTYSAADIKKLIASKKKLALRITESITVVVKIADIA